MQFKSSAEMLAELRAKQGSTDTKPIELIPSPREAFHFPDYFGAYCKLTRVAVHTDTSQMDVPTHREFVTIIDRAQQILRLELLQAGFSDPRELPMHYGAENTTNLPS